MAREYRERRDIMAKALERSGFKFSAPEGAYYMLADFSAISKKKSKEFAVWLAEEVGVARVPGMSFYAPASLGKSLTRPAFCKKKETLDKAAERLANLKG